MPITRQNIRGNAATANQLQTTRTIGGVSFNGSASIDLPGVNQQGNQNTTGNAATANNAAQLGGVPAANYATKDGAGASGTWGISITGGAGYATSAGSVAWTGVTGRPTALSAFTNDPGFITALSVLPTNAGAAVGAVGTYATLRYESAEAAINPGDTKGAADLRYANVAGNSPGTTPPAGSVWRCMGYASNSSSTNRTTNWLRIS